MGADPTKVRGQLTEYGLVPEEYGGDTMFVDVSAVTGQGLDSLLEAVILTADAALDLRANPDMDAQGVAIEAHLDKGRGPVATGPGAARHAQGRRLDRHGSGPRPGTRAARRSMATMSTEAPPSFPVQVLGLTAVPGAGDSFLVVDDDRMARQIAERRAARLRMAAQAAGTRRKTLDQLFEQLEKGETQELRLILKGDGAGSVGGSGGRAVQDRRRRRGQPAGDRSWCWCYHRDQRLAGCGLRCRHRRLQRPAAGQGARSSLIARAWTSATTR